MRILVVEDEEKLAASLKEGLEADSYTVTVAHSGEEGFYLVHTQPFDLIILDVLLSGKDGRLICRKLKGQEETRHIPIIMISAHPGADRSVREVGADDFLAKPFEVDALLAMVARYV